MTSVDNLRDNIIEKLLAISNKDYLSALNQLIEKSLAVEATIPLTDEQRRILQLSELDIRQGNLITQEQVDQEDQEWLKEL